MPIHYVNNARQANGDHEVHVAGCRWLKRAQSVGDLGDHLACFTAVRAARQIHPTANGCAYCARACHLR